jgi:ABC-type glycerol-3-phosphate transport system permease component
MSVVKILGERTITDAAVVHNRRGIRGILASPTRRRIAAFYAIAIIFAFVFLFPTLWMFITSVRTTQDIYQIPPTFWPSEITFENYVYVLTEMDGGTRYFLNSIVVTLSSVFLVVFASAMGGYAFGVRRFWGKELLFMGIVFVLTIPYIMYLIPIYIMEIKMHLRNTWLGLILPYVALNLPWGLLIMRSAFSTIPLEIRDAAIIDGCNEFQLWYKVMLPITRPALAATVIITFVFVWQEYLFASTLMTKNAWQTLPVGIVWLRDELQTMAYGRIGAMFILSILPIFVPFILLRNFFIKGLSEGMLKG